MAEITPGLAASRSAAAQPPRLALPALAAQPATRVADQPRLTLPASAVRPASATAPPPPRAAPTPAPAAPAPATPLPAPPAAPAPGAPNPFDELPYPAPGDRIRADDFRRLSQCLEIVRDAFLLSGSIVGRPLGEARAVLAAGGYTIERVVSVFGSIVADAEDGSADGRLVVHAALAALGERRVVAVISEPVETRRLTPDLTRRTYADAVNILRAAIGDAKLPGGTIPAPQLVGRSLDDVAAAFSR